MPCGVPFPPPEMGSGEVPLARKGHSVRAGMVEEPAEYRRSSYGEAVGGGRKGNGKKARIGLIPAIQNPKARDRIDTERWNDVTDIYLRAVGLAPGRKGGGGRMPVRGRSNPAEALEKGDGSTTQEELGMVKMRIFAGKKPLLAPASLMAHCGLRWARTAAGRGSYARKKRKPGGASALEDGPAG